jgi:hypothetical protein
MGLHQDFRFEYESAAQVQGFLRGLGGIAEVEDRGDFFVFTSKNGPRFSFDCELKPYGLRTNRGGEYFAFLGQFIEGLTGEFGCVEVEDA